VADRITKGAALRAVRSKLPILSEKKLQEQLEYAVGSLAEAYRIGAEEAQHVIVVRIEQAFERAARKVSQPMKEVLMRASGQRPAPLVGEAHDESTS